MVRIRCSLCWGWSCWSAYIGGVGHYYICTATHYTNASNGSRRTKPRSLRFFHQPLTPQVPVLVAMIWVSVAMLRVFTVSSRRCALSYENVASEELSQAERWCGFSWLCNRQFSGRRYILANVLSVLNWKTNGWFLWHFWVLFRIWELKTADMQVIVNSDCVSCVWHIRHCVSAGMDFQSMIYNISKQHSQWVISIFKYFSSFSKESEFPLDRCAACKLHSIFEIASGFIMHCF